MFGSLHIGAVLSQGALPVFNVPAGSTREPSPPPAKPSHHFAEEDLERPTDVSALALFTDTGIASAPPAAHNVRRNSERDFVDEIDEIHELDLVEPFNAALASTEEEALPVWVEPPSKEIYTLTGLELN